MKRKRTPFLKVTIKGGFGTPGGPLTTILGRTITEEQFEGLHRLINEDPQAFMESIAQLKAADAPRT